ncbi:sensor histidine kinase [Actinomadura luteofluorescens]|uniref:histidine kinase n=1 Tax=Actinomadura luteofluorescens TaxID=46163 RepID=A0A7Y9EE56_9ACTN|nr:sensor histidine kinase [Actinomadura luteofluorescens]NYD46144.1 signal transduction histidine kinase [Actinomadura luteofluorescens]
MRLADRDARPVPWLPTGRTADAALAGGAFAVLAAMTLVSIHTGSPSRMPLYSWALLVVACGALYFRRSHPVAVAAVTLAACAVYYPVTEPDGPAVLTFVVALYTAAAEGHLTAAVVLVGIAVAGTVAGDRRDDVNHLADAAGFLLIGWFVAVVAIGGVVRNRRAYLREAQERARVAERGREAEARRRAIEERLRIARELHDVLGHNISLINVQATAALHGLRREPQRAEDALTAIKQASKDVLREMRATLGVLRQVDEAAPVAPAPGLARLDELTGGLAAAGLKIRTEVEGEPRPLPAEADLAAYRIVQEALTNVTRHSGATSAVVRVRYGAEDVVVSVEDDGTPGSGAPSAGGSGIRGMRDRAEALGGGLDAGPGPDGGFTVRARLPL